ncbi:hypothetical protein QBC40DRAFT_342337 [Triangularia verruculosa]|uniref:Uncharacterized protein n=1 Tax=Triangularia verruculosa TaxID=2587418 RepID=A0AAN6XAZ1_9PEZI|nr:hypothetical protein QBC40DRAFT_342337 [Triangularia verruculosa]
MLSHVLAFLVLGLGRLVAADTFDTSVCLFHLCSVDASSNNLTVGQIPGGQLEGSPVTESATWFRLYNGRLLDQSLRGCWWAWNSTVLVCDVSFSDVEEPDQLFSVTMHGDHQALAYNGTFSFYACRNGRYDRVNYYLNQTDATCSQVFLHIDPDMACFDEPYSSTSTTPPVFSFTTTFVPLPGETIITSDLLSTITGELSTYATTGTAGDDGTSTTTVTTAQVVYTTHEVATATDTHTALITLPEPSSLPPIYSTHPHSHSLSSIKPSLTTHLPLSPPLPSISTLYPDFNSTLYKSLTTPAGSDLSTIPYKSFTSIYSWNNSTHLPSTLKTTAVASGGYSHSRIATATRVTPTTFNIATTRSSPKPSLVATTLIVHTEHAEGTGPVVETFTVTGEQGAVFTFAVEVEGSDS